MDTAGCIATQIFGGFSMAKKKSVAATGGRNRQRRLRSTTGSRDQQRRLRSTLLIKNRDPLCIIKLKLCRTINLTYGT